MDNFEKRIFVSVLFARGSITGEQVGEISEWLDEKPENIARVFVDVLTEKGCSIEKGEYTILLLGVLDGVLDITDLETGAGDIHLIRDCIRENEDKLPEEGVTEFELQASGEWEGEFWHKYFEVAYWGVLTDEERERRIARSEERESQKNTVEDAEHQRERMALHIIHDRLTLVTEWIEETLGYDNAAKGEKYCPNCGGKYEN